MRLVFGLVLVVGVGLAGFATWKTADYINKTKAAEQRARAQIVPTVDVFVANKPLPFGHVLKPEDVVRVAWPRRAMPENVFTEMEQLFPGDGAKRRTVIRQMERSEPLMAVKLTEPGEDAGLNTRLGRGMRALTIRVDNTSGVSGFLRPGDRVDVYWTGNTSGVGIDMQGDVTRLIETGVTIIAVDSNTQQEASFGGNAARTVTVEATPQQVARLAQAQVTGRLVLSLLGIADDTAADAVDVDKRALLGVVLQEAAPIIEERVCSIRTRRGADVVEIPIPCTN